MSSRRSVCLAAWLAATCGDEKFEPPVATPSSPDAPVVAAPATVVETPSLDSAALVGRWRSDSVCLELFASGDFELSMQSSRPKLMVLGRATLTLSADSDLGLQLAVTRIWRARYTGPCRTISQFGRWSESERLLGVEFRPDSSVLLKLRRTGDEQLELCGETCETLTRATPALPGRWRRAGVERPDRPDPAWAVGDLLELELGDHSGHLWTGLTDNKFATAYGPLTAEFVADHRFTLRFTAHHHARVPHDVTPTAFGVTLVPGATLELDARRLADEHLEVCLAPGRCTTLERQFSDYHHDIH